MSVTIDLTAATAAVSATPDRRAELVAALTRTSPTRAAAALGDGACSDDPLWDVAQAMVRLRASRQPVPS